MNYKYTNIELFNNIKEEMNDWKKIIRANIRLILDWYGEDNSINVENLQGYKYKDKFLDTELIGFEGIYIERVYIDENGDIVLGCCYVRTLNPNNRSVNYVLDNSFSLDLYMQVFELLCVYEKIEQEKLEKSK